MSDFKRWMSLIDEQRTLAVLFQIKMSVCIVSLPVTKGPPQHTNCSFWKVLLGYRPAWRWNVLCIAFLQLYSSDIMSNLLCVQCSCMSVSICVYSMSAHLSFSFLCVLEPVCERLCLCHAKLAYYMVSLLSLSIFCNRTPFVWWAVRSQSYCHTSESPPADTSGCAQRINSVCLMFNYTL